MNEERSARFRFKFGLAVLAILIGLMLAQC